MGSLQAEAAGVTERVEHPAPGRERRHNAAVVALIQIESRLLPLAQINQITHGPFRNDDRFGGDAAAKGAVLDFQSFELPDAALGAQPDAGGLNELLEQVGEQFATLG